MTPQELKNSILQLAIQGKLVPQDPTEGTGEELYKQIQAEKEKLIKEGKIKKEKPLPSITEDVIPFDIPDSWKWIQLGYLAEINGGFAFKSTDYTEAGIRVIRISDFNESGFVDTKMVRHPFSKELSPYMLEKENILLCMTGGTVGKSFFVRELAEPMMVNQRVATIKIKKVLPQYINYNILAPLIQMIIQHSKNSTNDNISMETIKAFPIPLPPFAEQKRIVAKIEELLPLIDRYEEAYTKLGELNARFPVDMQKSILQMAIQGKLVPQDPSEGTGEELYKQIQKEKVILIKEGKIKKEKPLPEIAEDEIPFEIPDSWKWVRLGEAFCIEMGQSPDGKTVSEICDGIEFHQGKVFFGKKYLSLSPQKTTEPTKIAEPNSVLLCVRAPVGKVNITQRRICIGRGLCAVSPVAGMTVDFAYYLLATYENTFIRQATGTTFVAITGEVVKNQPIPLPPLAEQKRIVSKLEEILPLCERLKK